MKGSIFYIIGVLALTTGLYSNIGYERHASFYQNQPVVDYVLDIDMTDKGVSVEHGFSFGVLYGFQTVSEIAAANDAEVAINGMFYNDLGMPLGTMVHEGRPIRIQNLSTPMLLIGANNELVITEAMTGVKVLINEGYVWLYSVNGRVPNGSWGLFDRIYGSTTRIQRPSTNYIIENNMIIDIIKTDTPVKLNQGDYVLAYAGEDSSYEIGDEVAFDYNYGFEEFLVKTGFHTGGWLVREGINVAKDFEPFVGYTTNKQPRTLVGVTREGHLILVAVDGRQVGYSLGVSGYDAGELMLSYGCSEAAYLDGGASTTMFYDGEMKNNPSGKEERRVAHAILIFD